MMNQTKLGKKEQLYKGTRKKQNCFARHSKQKKEQWENASRFDHDDDDGGDNGRCYLAWPFVSIPEGESKRECKKIEYPDCPLIAIL